MKCVIVEKRTPLSEWAFIIPGSLIVLITSILLITKVSEHPNAMKLFLYIGIIFLVIGIIKFLIKNYNKNALKGSEEKFASKLAGFPQNKNENKNYSYDKSNERIKQAQGHNKENNMQQKTTQRIEEVKKTVPSIISCSRCGKNYSLSNFGNMCVKKL